MRQRHIEHHMPDYSAFLAHQRSPDIESPPGSQESSADNERPFESSPEFSKHQKYIRDWISKSVDCIIKDFPPMSRLCPASVKEEDDEDHSIYTGTGSNAYLHWKLARFYEAEEQKEKADLHREYAVSAIEVALKMLPSKYPKGEEIAFYTGSAGTYDLFQNVLCITHQTL